MPSHSSIPTRRAPQQDRSTRRVQEFLEAAETLFAQQGFESATMTAIAERSGSSIGALYSYFPDKKSVAFALLDSYAASIEAYWQPTFSAIPSLSAEQFATRFVDSFLDFIAEHPAFLQLLTAPVRLRRNTSTKRAFRVPLIKALQRRAPSLQQPEAELCANVLLRIMHGMMQMYNDVEPRQRTAVTDEYKTVLSAYLETIFPNTAKI